MRTITWGKTNGSMQWTYSKGLHPLGRKRARPFCCSRWRSHAETSGAGGRCLTIARIRSMNSHLFAKKALWCSARDAKSDPATEAFRCRAILTAELDFNLTENRAMLKILWTLANSAEGPKKNLTYCVNRRNINKKENLSFLNFMII